jgi:hypothetical protein
MQQASPQAALMSRRPIRTSELACRRGSSPGRPGTQVDRVFLVLGGGREGTFVRSEASLRREDCSSSPAPGDAVLRALYLVLLDEDEKRTVFELQVDEVGPALRYATAKINKVSRSSGVSVSTDDAWGGHAGAYRCGAGAGDKPQF